MTNNVIARHEDRDSVIARALARGNLILGTGDPHVAIAPRDDVLYIPLPMKPIRTYGSHNPHGPHVKTIIDQLSCSFVRFPYKKERTNTQHQTM